MMHIFFKQNILALYFVIQIVSGLYPFETSTRTKISLNGLWDFKVDFQNEGLEKNWQTKVFKTEVSSF